VTHTHAARPSRPRLSRLAGPAAAVLTAALALAPVGPAQAQNPQSQLKFRSEQAIPPTFNQGLAHIPGGWIISGTNSPIPGTDVLARTDERFNIQAINQPAIPPQWRTKGYDHVGDIDVVGNTIYAPFEQPNYALGHQATARYDATTLAFRDAVELPQHQNSFVAVDPASLVAFTMDEFDGNSLLRYDAGHGWTPLTPLPLSMTLHHTQGASVRDGFVWISTSDPADDIFRVNESTGEVETMGQLGHPGGEGEGIDATSLDSGYVHAMVVDPDLTRVWVQHFDVIGSAAPGGPAQPATASSTGSPRLAATGRLGGRPLLGLAAAMGWLLLSSFARSATAWRRRAAR
jgi:hypothetical protein